MILLEGMREAGGDVSPDVVSFNTCIKACGSANELPQALKVPHFRHVKLHIGRIRPFCSS
jgi:hypothetical protein